MYIFKQELAITHELFEKKKQQTNTAIVGFLPQISAWSLTVIAYDYGLLILQVLYRSILPISARIGSLGLVLEQAHHQYPGSYPG